MTVRGADPTVTQARQAASHSSHESGAPEPVLPEELVEFLRDAGARWLKAVEVTARRWKSPKRAFRIDLADGGVAKARVLRPGRSAERVAALLGSGGAARRCARVIAGRGRCLLEEWVDGESLAATPTSPTLLVECGRALADIHRTPLGSGISDPTDSASGRERVRYDLASLHRADRLTRPEVEALLAMADATAVPDGPCGLVHLDYCGENIVFHAERGPVCIDNETVGTGPFAFDCARTVTRWSLDAQSRRRFLDGYVAAGGPADLRHLEFWTLAADATSARLRVEHGNPDVDEPLQALRRRIGGSRSPDA